MKIFYTFTADQIKGMLAARHANDIFVTECKSGNSWYNNNLLKLDGWALKRTYSPFTTIGYEIKVARSDFEQDQKWTGYREFCHEFFFVCPGGLIQSHELPIDVGLIWVSSTGKLHVKRKAEHKEPEPAKLRELMTYVLMSRSVIVADMNEANAKCNELTAPDKFAAKKKYIEDAQSRKELAWFVKGHVKAMAEHYAVENKRLIEREETLKRFCRDLERVGIKWAEDGGWLETSRVEKEIALLKNTLPSNMLWQMKSGAETMIKLCTEIEELRKEN